MGDYTVREVLRRRSAETLRKIQQRRDQHGKKEPESGGKPWLVIVLLLLTPPLGYVGWVAKQALAQGIGGGPRNIQVFMRPLVLAPDARLDPVALRDELSALGYHAGSGDAELAAGEYRAAGDTVAFHSRAFRFSEGAEPERMVNVRFNAGRVTALEADGAVVKQFRLDPILLGSIVPAGAPERVSLVGAEIPDRVRHMMVAALDPKAQSRGVVSAAFEPDSLARRYAALKLEDTRRPWAREVDEAVFAAAFGIAGTPNKILDGLINEAHINTIDGRDIHGLGLGASFLFGRPLAVLETHQVALLVAMVQAGGALDPRSDPSAARLARDAVLDAAVAGDALIAPVAEAAKLRDLDVLPSPPSSSSFDPDLLHMVESELMRDFINFGDALPGGMRVFTSLDPGVQSSARSTLLGMRNLAGLGTATEGAAVFARYADGEVLAAVGGLGEQRRLNLATDNIRPIGALALSATYLAAVGNGYGPLTTVDDSPLEVELPGGVVWAPKNVDGRSHGREPLISALVGGHVVALSRVALEIGVPEVVDALRRLGAPRAIDAHPAIVGGEIALSPIEVAQLFATVLQVGRRAPLHAVRAVVDPDGGAMARRVPIAATRTGSDREGYLLLRALQFVAHTSSWRGAMPAKSDAAAIAGLGSGLRDAWAAGGDGRIAGVVWFGRNDAGLTLGASTAAAEVLGRVLTGIGSEPLIAARPNGVSDAWVDIDSGAAVGADCSGAVQLAFPVALAPAATTECRGGAAAVLRRLMGGGT